MRGRTTTTKVTRRGLGLAFLAVLVLLGWFTYASFTKTFTPVEHVTLRTSHIGLQLNEHADVKLRGMIVGEVRSIDIDIDNGGGARLDLALEPDKMSVIPADVSARIIPKTLFGEKYVELVVPDEPSDQTLLAGATIGPDRSQVGTELEAVLDDVYPLLRTIKPAKLNATLNAMSTALEGRGDKVGGNLVRLNNYLEKLEPHIPTLNEDVEELADVADVYREATPDLMRLLENSTKTGRTVIVKERVLADFLTDLTETSGTTREFLAENERDLIELGEVSRPNLDLLATYSPEYPCTLEAMVDWIPRIEDAFGVGEHVKGSAPALHLTLELVPQRASYTRDDKPQFLDDRGPGCRTLPDPPYSQENPGPGSGVETGVTRDPATSSRDISGITETGGNAETADTAAQPDAADVLFETTNGYTGTEAEQELVNALLGPVMEQPADEVPDLATLLFGPMARGAEVNVR